ncbi:hypothetical protein L7F22_046369 [Adiantum nelumboides]|nr:hypothetical protein [Adiantum nelumboides]
MPTGNGAGWNDVPHQQQYPQQAPRGQQPAWQAAAQARVAQYENADGAGGQVDGSLDQIPGQRNMISPEQAAHNHAAMRAAGGMGAVGQQQQQQHPGMGQQPQIQQPPHSAGQRFAGPRSKIDPDQIPSPVEAQDADQEFFDREWFATCGRGGLPLSTTDFGAVDQGNCSPKHMRLTTYSMPQTEELALTSQLPLAIVCSTFRTAEA